MGAQARVKLCRFLLFASVKMAPAMKSMKTAMKTGVLTQSAVYASVAETTGLKQKQVKGVVEGIMGVASEQLKKNGAFKLAGMMNMKLKKKPATPARKGVNPFTRSHASSRPSLPPR